MTAAPIVRAAGRRVSGQVWTAAIIAALIVAGFVSGTIPVKPWEPFLRLDTWTFLGRGLVVTLVMGGVSLVLALAIGIPLAMARSSLRGPIGWLISGYIELVRATPILALLLIIFLGVSRLGIDLPAIQAAIVGLTIYNSATIAEIVRAGIKSIPGGEVEAARSLGLNYWQTMRLVVLPQAIARMMPAIVSQLITLMKDTSLAFILGAQELVGFGRSFFTFYGNVLETYIVLAVVFFLINYPLSLISRRLEAGRAPTERPSAVLGKDVTIA